MFLEIVPPTTIVKDAAIDLLKDAGKWILKHLLGMMCADFYMTPSAATSLCSHIAKVGSGEWFDLSADRAFIFDGVFWISKVGFAYITKEKSDHSMGFTEKRYVSYPTKDMIRLSVFRWNQRAMRGLIKERHAELLGSSKRPTIDVDAMCLNRDAERVLREVKVWHGDEDWYKSRGISYNFGILIYGPPGSGKSTFALKVSEVTGRSINKLDIVRNKNFLEGIKSPCSVWVIEDIDTVFNGRTNVSGSDDPLDFGDLLNALSGVIASYGRIVIITTNAPEGLDPALAHIPTNGDPPVPRPGRIDRILYIGAMEAQAREKMVRKILPDRSDLWHDVVLAGEGETVALFQARCVQIALSNRP